MNTSAQPADTRAARALGTVKNRMITCGSPAVPNMSAAVMQNTSAMDLSVDVYSRKPRSRTTVFSLSSMAIFVPSTFDTKPSCGTGFPVTMIEMKIAGTVYAKINTQYCATCV